MSRNDHPDERPRPPSALVLMVLLSLSLHLGLVAAVTVFARPGEKGLTGETFAISLRHPPLQLNNLPPLEGSRDAGPLQGIEPQTQHLVERPKLEQPKAEEEEPAKKPPEDEERPRQKARQAPEQKPRTEPQRREPAQRVISTRNSKPEPEPETPRRLRERLEARADVLSQTENVAGGTVSQHFAMEGDSSGGVPDTIRKTLMALVWQNWKPPGVRLGEVKEAVVEFTLYSPPLLKNSINRSRPRSQLTEMELAKSSGDDEFDRSVLNAIRRLRTMTLPPLPQYYKKSQLVVSCRFYYIGDERDGM